MVSLKQRELTFGSVDEILPEIQRLASMLVETSGNFTLAQIIDHLARSNDVVTGKLPSPQIPLPVRMMTRTFRGFILSRPFKPGIKLPPTAQSIFWCDAGQTVDDAIGHYEESLVRYREMNPLPRHILFGNLTRERHDRLQCLHSALHLSLVHPIG
jgi:hypothetical protein